VASSSLVREFAAEMSTRMIYLPQATSWADTPPVCAPLERHRKALFVGNARGKMTRDTVKLALDSGTPLDIIGNHWKGLVPDHHLLTKFIDNDLLPDIYGKYLVALNDHWGPMRPCGFINNRLYDTLACGAIPICDDIDITDPELRELVYQVRNPEEMKAAFNEILSLSEEAILERQNRARALIKPTYSFDAAASVILRELDMLVEQRMTSESRARARAHSHPPDVFCDWLGSNSDNTAEVCKPNPPVICLGGHQYALPEEIADGESVALASRIVRIADRVLDFANIPQTRVITDVLSQDDKVERHYLSINPMTANYRDLVALISSSNGTVQTEALRNSIRELRQIAHRYLARSAYSRHSQNPMSRFVPVDLADRLLNDCYTYPGLKIEPIDRNFFKPYLRMTPLPNDSLQGSLRVAAVIHAFHPDVLPRILDRLSFFQNRAVYCSTDTEEKALQIEASLAERGFEFAEVRVMPNVGRDVYPKLFGFADVLPDFDLFLHLHTKKSLHISDNDWLGNILDDIVTDSGTIRRIISLFEDFPWLGCIYPRTHHAIMANDWGVNKEMGREILRRLGLAAVPKGGSFRVPAGSMYWMRSEALQQIANLNLVPEDFHPERGQLDGTLAHALERVVGLVPGMLEYYSVCFTGTKDRLYNRFCQQVNNNKRFGKLARDLFPLPELATNR